MNPGYDGQYRSLGLPGLSSCQAVWVCLLYRATQLLVRQVFPLSRFLVYCLLASYKPNESLPGAHIMTIYAQNRDSLATRLPDARRR